MIKNRLKKFDHLKVTLWLLAISVLTPAPAFADTAGTNKLLTILQATVQYLSTSKFIRCLFVLGIIGIGYGWLALGRIPKGRAVGAILGIGIVFSASYIANQLGVTGN